MTTRQIKSDLYWTPKKGGWTSIQFSGKTLGIMEGGGIGIHTYLGIILANYQNFIDDLLDLWDRGNFWNGMELSHLANPDLRPFLKV